MNNYLVIVHVRYQYFQLSKIFMVSTSIRVNVYDLSKTNSVARGTRPCIYHTSVVVGEEFEIYYGFYRYGVTGIDYAEKIDHLPSSMKGRLYKSYHLGNCRKSIQFCRQIIERFKANPAWLSDRYNFIYNNCHKFSFTLCESLLGRGNTFKYPTFVFDCEKIGHALYRGVISRFIDEDHPPACLGKVLDESPEPFRWNFIEEVAPEILSF
ncbi:hypothetical protein TRFO_16841 [Tritrichomonas foetus]|uniref:PPPDE domain-containing protein n=1 Tax=Tritrichomonas foetus TaxID=1144522 RepID=A0A1J4KQI2_9EUKA|nr:hypothetical protein TRFO_16841 [Tritrichomonas foetus]|eukprot:OHT13168.1 hypothetical protein TRFO_16841 [Tritrichomonas foetus]